MFPNSGTADPGDSRAIPPSSDGLCGCVRFRSCEQRCWLIIQCYGGGLSREISLCVPSARILHVCREPNMDAAYCGEPLSDLPGETLSITLITYLQ